MQITVTEFIILSLATWRLASLLANEAGPYHMFQHLRRRIAQAERHSAALQAFHLYEGTLCEWCNSIWFGTGIGITFVFYGDIVVVACLPLALSAVAIIIKLAVIHPARLEKE